MRWLADSDQVRPTSSECEDASQNQGGWEALKACFVARILRWFVPGVVFPRWHHMPHHDDNSRVIELEYLRMHTCAHAHPHGSSFLPGRNV